jgi:3-hydroxymyristoyl/3-hydroxydecanoyl-(acyl carrier protein) dehydratase
MSRPIRPNLALGPELLVDLLPHRRPFVLVDRVIGLRPDPPGLLAEKLVSTNEPVFDGHFGRVALWPGVYTIEALAQASIVLFRLLALGADDPEGTRKALLALSSARRLGGAPLSEAAQALDARIAALPMIGVVSAVDVKLGAPVFAGQVLALEVELDEDHGASHRLRVRASADRREVATGTLTVALRPVPDGLRLG